MLTSLSASAVTGEQVYGPYGNQRYTQGTLGTDKGYTGQFSDALSGLDYYNARYYDPVIGAFLSPDNVQGAAQGFDPYVYVAGNPETATDPTGHLVIDGGVGNKYLKQAEQPRKAVSVQLSPSSLPKPKPVLSLKKPTSTSGSTKSGLSSAMHKSAGNSSSAASKCDGTCLQEEKVQQNAKDTAASFQSFANWASNFTSAWIWNLIGSVSGLNAILSAWAAIARAYAKAFTAVANASLDHLDWEGVQLLTQNGFDEAANITAKDVFITLGLSAASIVLPFIGEAISSLGGTLATKLGGAVTGIGLFGPIGGTIVASSIWVGSYIMENVADDNLGYEEQTAPY